MTFAPPISSTKRKRPFPRHRDQKMPMVRSDWRLCEHLKRVTEGVTRRDTLGIERIEKVLQRMHASPRRGIILSEATKNENVLCPIIHALNLVPMCCFMKDFDETFMRSLTKNLPTIVGTNRNTFSYVVALMSIVTPHVMVKTDFLLMFIKLSHDHSEQGVDESFVCHRTATWIMDSLMQYEIVREKIVSDSHACSSVLSFPPHSSRFFATRKASSRKFQHVVERVHRGGRLCRDGKRREHAVSTTTPYELVFRRRLSRRLFVEPFDAGDGQQKHSPERRNLYFFTQVVHESLQPVQPMVVRPLQIPRVQAGKCTSIACQLAEGLERVTSRSQVFAFQSTISEIAETLSTCEKSSNVERLASCLGIHNVDALKNARKKVESQVHEYLCPITLSCMRDPVVASDGHSYEREAIMQVIGSTRISPITRDNLLPQVYPNHTLKKRIRSDVEKCM